MSTPAERLARSEQAATAHSQWVSPALMLMKADYLKKLAEVAAQPMSDKVRAQIEKLALAIKVVDHVDTEMLSVINDGALAKHDKDRADRLANMTTEARKWAMF